VIRAATTDDLPLVRELWDEFGAEIQDAPWRDSDHDDDLARIEKALADGGVLLAGEDGIAVVSTTGSRTAELDLLHVRPRARGKGLAGELMREAVNLVRERGLEMLELHVLASNTEARAVYERWGFEPVELVVAAPVEALEQRLTPADGPTFGFVHVQTDDVDKVKRDAAKYLRLEPDVEVEGNWVRVRSEATDEDPELLKALAKELSYTSGGVTLSLGVQRGAVVRYDLFDRGSDIDEYQSIPEYFGPLPPGDVYALGANATVVGRLTGADPRRVREVAKTAVTATELPPAQELYEQLATVMGVQP
jgi:ribosomal protein S18 acetylase RimI-like enzyme